MAPKTKGGEFESGLKTLFTFFHIDSLKLLLSYYFYKGRTLQGLKAKK